MPSGAKKRKAAKKKKENQSTNPSSPSTHSHGDEDAKFKDGGEEHIEAEESALREREFYKKNGGSSRSSSSSSSSSDDESHGVKNSQAEAVVEIASVVDSPKTADSFSGSTAEAVKDDSIREDVPVADSGESSLLVEKVEACTSSPADNSVVPLVISVLEENGEKKPSSDVDKVGPSVALVDTPSEREEEVIVQSVEKVDIVLDPKESVIPENDDKLTVSFNAPTASTDDDQAETEKGSEVTKPLLPPPPVQRSSWKSCCGLFEVFSGSST